MTGFKLGSSGAQISAIKKKKKLGFHKLSTTVGQHIQVSARASSVVTAVTYSYFTYLYK